MEKENTIIIGSGPAGHTAAIYAARAELNPLMYEGYMAGGVAAGGQLTTTTEVENFPGFPDGVDGTELMNRMRQQSINSGTRIETKTVEKVNLQKYPFSVFVEGQEIETKSIIISTGAIAKTLGIPGEKDFWNKGISACAVCDGALPIFRKKHLAVVGGGDAALEEAMFLTKYASKVTLYVRKDHLRASKAMQEKAYHNDNLEIIWNTEVKKAMGENILNSIETYNNQTGAVETVEVGGLFYAIGHRPNTEFLEGQLELDETGYIVTKNGSTETSVEGVFAAGDVQDKIYRQAITSAGTGCMAALDAEKFLD